MNSSNSDFNWKCQPEAEKLLLDILQKVLDNNPNAHQLQRDLFSKTSTRIFDWIDFVTVPINENIQKELKRTGFVILNQSENLYHHPGAQLPRVKLSNQNLYGIAVQVESISDFLLASGGLNKKIEGTPFSSFRQSIISAIDHYEFSVVERRGALSVKPIYEPAKYLESYLQAKEIWATRDRAAKDEDRAINEALKCARQMIDLVGKNLAAWIVLEEERRYWQLKNSAGQFQKNRQDSLGMGWANHDHHTFRSSRQHFKKLVELFELLGFHCRERFYAGAEAGWGAQVMENSDCRLILFLDVDLDPQEIEGDFAHEDLPELPQLGTIGLWCALHGDSILKAGMHHLEAQFMFEELAHDLAKTGIKMMNPFSNFPYLKQAFTHGELWPVEKARVLRLVEQGKITQEQGEKFIAHGAVGSHLENLQRREGYKGFNQKNVSVIIKKTDPRNIDK